MTMPGLNNAQTFRDHNAKSDDAIVLLNYPNRITRTGATAELTLPKLNIQVPAGGAIRIGDVIELQAILGKSNDANNCDLNFIRETAAGSSTTITQFRLTTALHQMVVRRFYRVEDTNLAHMPTSFNTAAVVAAAATTIDRAAGFRLRFSVQVADAASVLTVDALRVLLHPNSMIPNFP